MPKAGELGIVKAGWLYGVVAVLLNYGDHSSGRGSDCHCKASDRATASFYLNLPTFEAGSMSVIIVQRQQSSSSKVIDGQGLNQSRVPS